MTGRRSLLVQVTDGESILWAVAGPSDTNTIKRAIVQLEIELKRLKLDALEEKRSDK